MHAQGAIAAARAGNTAALALLPSAALHAPDARGSTALHWAAGSGQLDAVRWLVEQRAVPPNCLETPPPGSGRRRGISNRTPLHFAARNGHLAVVQYLCGLGRGRAERLESRRRARRAFRRRRRGADDTFARRRRRRGAGRRPRRARRLSRRVI